jgi:cytochrome P450
MEQISLQVILRCVFGINEESRIQVMGKLILDFLDEMMSPKMLAACLTFGAWRVRDYVRAGIGRERAGFRPPSVHRISRLLGGIEEILRHEIRRRREQPDQDILSLLVSIRFDDGSAMSEERLIQDLIMLLAAAYETTAATLGWTVYCLLRHPETLAKLRAELRTVMAGRFQPSRVKELVYTGAVVNEAMRLYPISTLISRQLKQDTELAGYRLPAGTIVAPCTYLVHRDARIWPEPETFQPERFLDGKAPIYHFFPFGAGVWRCIGAQFAEYEMRVVLARLVEQVDLELASRRPGDSARAARNHRRSLGRPAGARPQVGGGSERDASAGRCGPGGSLMP